MRGHFYLRIFSLFAALLAGVNSGIAGDLLTPFELESASVLPTGIRNPRFKSFFFNTSERLNGLGATEPLAAPLNRSVTFADVLAARKTSAEKAQIQSLLSASGGNPEIPLTALAGQIQGDVETRVAVFMPSLGYGVTDRWTLGICVPVVSGRIDVSSGFSRSSLGQDFVNRVNSSASPLDAEKAAADISNGFNQQIADYGYEPLRSRSLSGVGDIRLQSKHLLYRDDRQRMTLKGLVTAPTGDAPNPNRLVDLSTGDGQWDLAAIAAYDVRRIVGNFGIGTFAGYTAQLPGELDKRVPQPGQALTSDKERLTRDLGDSVSAGATVQWEMPRTGMTLATGYTFQYQGDGGYIGSKFEAERYRALSAQLPSQSLHTMTVAASFSSVDFYRSGRFAAPIEAMISYSTALSGRNVLVGDVIGGELVFFF